MTSVDFVDLVVCAAPLARHAPRIVAELQADGYQVRVTASFNAGDWLDAAALQDATDGVGLQPARRPGEPRRRPRPGAVLLIPGTFNTLNKLRHGISDTPALGVLNDAVGQQLPLLVVPMVSERLVGHPAWRETLTWLQTVGVSVMDPATGRLDALTPLTSGSGDDAAARFDTAAVVRWMKGLD